MISTIWRSTARAAWRTLRQPVAISAITPSSAVTTIGSRPSADGSTMAARIAAASGALPTSGRSLADHSIGRTSGSPRRRSMSACLPTSSRTSPGSRRSSCRRVRSMRARRSMPSTLQRLRSGKLVSSSVCPIMRDAGLIMASDRTRSLAWASGTGGSPTSDDVRSRWPGYVAKIVVSTFLVAATISTSPASRTTFSNGGRIVR